MNYEEELNDDNYIEDTDIFIGDFLIEFINEAFYCNGSKVTHEVMIDKLDYYLNITDFIEMRYKEEDREPLEIPIFNMHIDINLLQETIDKFNL